jgi:hypothetical protein
LDVDKSKQGYYSLFKIKKNGIQTTYLQMKIMENCLKKKFC